MPHSVAPRLPMYPPGAPGLGQQIFYGQPPHMIPPQVNTYATKFIPLPPSPFYPHLFLFASI